MIPLHWVNSLSLYIYIYFFCEGSHCILFTTTRRGLTQPCCWLQVVNPEKATKKRRNVEEKELQRWSSRAGGGREKCSVDPFVSSSTVGALTASCLRVTLCGPSQTWAFLSHAHPIKAIMAVMIPFISASLWMHLFSRVILYWLIVMDWLD